MNKWVIIGITAFLVSVFFVWLFKESSKPLPGEKTLQEGRKHVPESEMSFQFNPPTSGDHDAAWITKGFYDEPRSDGSLVHSLEHGYVIVWYDCEKKATGYRQQGIIKTAFAHEEATPAATDNSSGMTGGSSGVATKHFEDMPKSFSDGSCDSLKNELKTLSENDRHKLIIMPRINMDKRIALTAWGRTLKLDRVDKLKIKQFIDAFRDNGPEKTVEP
ncbi:MAG: DUF3105 domain-containing protein [Candidatus Daviesbacteria bacterium]|nr:MAG: DUF3105 domain-containing protein [Candidatus Daviesbacteria bacterium]